jgi:mono/diheme cytochrome c family protein
MTISRICSIAILVGLVVAGLFSPPTRCYSADPTDVGKAVFKRANCMGCHKWHGNGGGGYGGDALSLRKTELAREQIIETVRCGRPGTGMPFFERGAYDATRCYGMNRQDAGSLMPPEAGVFLRTNDIEEVVSYVISHLKGKGEPDLADCVSFFSENSRACDIYRKSESSKSEQATPGIRPAAEAQ